MRYLCLLAALLLLPVTADAQQERRGNGRRTDRGADNRGSDNRGSADRRSEQRNSANTRSQTNTTGLAPTGLPPAQQRPVPAWEQKQTPWWERQGPPAWERRGAPWWEQNTAPAWQQTPPMRTVNTVNDQRQRGSNYRSSRHGRNGYIYIVPAYGYFPYSNYPYALPTYAETSVTPPPPTEIVTRPVEPPPAPEPPPPPIGVIRLEVEPRDLIQIYVDGVYVGTPDDVGLDLGLTPGVRHIELRARGYITHAFDADIVQDRLITYRAQLERDPNAPAPPVVVKPAGSRTMYVIPGCYVGNVAPTQANLRPGCDMSKLTTIEP